MASQSDIVKYCDDLLQAANYEDVAVNGLQVEGRADIQTIALAVSTSQRTIEQAIEWKADTLLVHHGLLWGSRSGPISGIFAKRLRLLLQHDLNLIGYHLPLDGHAQLGNNAQLIEKLGMARGDRFFGIGWLASASPARSLNALASRIEQLVKRPPVIVGETADDRPISTVAVVSGSGYGAVAGAASLGCDVLITGDVREPTMAEAREMGISVIAAGHEATERLGVQALGQVLAQQFGVTCRFIDDPNPI